MKLVIGESGKTWDRWVYWFAKKFANYYGLETKKSNRFKGRKNWCTFDFGDRYWIIDPNDNSNPHNVTIIAGHVHDKACEGILKSQYNCRIKYPKKFSPWIYYPNHPDNYFKFLNTRWNRDISKVKLVHFRGRQHAGRRKIVKSLKEYLNKSAGVISMQNYMKEIVKHRMALSLRGLADINHRDIELMGLGAPILRTKFSNCFYNEIQPDVHYVHVPKPTIASYIETIEKRIDDVDFLEYVSNNAIEWFDNNIRIENAIKLTAKIIGYEHQ